MEHWLWFGSELFGGKYDPIATSLAQADGYRHS